MLTKLIRVFTLLGMGLAGFIGFSSCRSIPVRVENVDAVTQHYVHQHVQVNFQGNPVPDQLVFLKVEGLGIKEGVTDSKGLVIFELDPNFRNRAGRIEIRPSSQTSPISANVELSPTGDKHITVDLDPTWAPEPPVEENSPSPASGDTQENGAQPLLDDIQTAEPELATFPYYENFEQPHDGWPLGRQTISGSDIELRLHNGSLVKIIHGFGEGRDHFLVPIYLPCDRIQDLQIDVVMAIQDSFPDDPLGFSIIFRKNENNDQYIARFGERGDFTLFAYHEGEMAIIKREVRPLSPTAENNSQDVYNTYSLTAEGSAISVYVNGELISETVNGLIFSPGRIGFAVDGRSGQSARIEIAEIAVAPLP